MGVDLLQQRAIDTERQDVRALDAFAAGIDAVAQVAHLRQGLQLGGHKILH